MADRPTEFVYDNIELYKSESLGSGSYGGVCKAKCDGLLCAAKIMHPTLFDLRDPGTASYLRKFREECHLLSLARHPNVVQYLGTYTDPDTRLPVLLMELCDESLTSFLERSPGPLSYHVQVNICHDIALALVYLHSNGLIHRDLTGNNVLMIAGPRAKITDFGMSKLAFVNPRMTALTLCPGNLLYMSPEALDEAKSYTAKLDVFSFGVIVIQILTRQFPNPTDRFCTVPNRKEGEDEESDEDEDDRREVRQVVPETERRQAHLQLISDTHSLKPLALQCLKQKERRRPSALQLSESLSELKKSSQYISSRQQVECSRCTAHQAQITELRQVVDRQIQEHQEIVKTMTTQAQANDRQLQEKEEAIAIQSQALEKKERDLLHTGEQLRASEKLVSEFQQSLEQKDKTIANLQQTILAHERKIHELEQQDTASGPNLPQQQPVTTPAQDISRMEAPVAMARGAAVVHGGIAYFRPADSCKIYSYQNILEKGCWSQLPDNKFENCGLAVVDNILTSVGGWNNGSTATVLSLVGEGMWKSWSVSFPPMSTPHSNAACVSTESSLIVFGGEGKFWESVDTVEVMDIDSKQWSTVCFMPQRCSSLSVALCGDTTYLLGWDQNGT